jgi:hypothetical protein
MFVVIFRTASLVTIKDGLIVHIELFYDARPLEKKRDSIFKIDRN